MVLQFFDIKLLSFHTLLTLQEPYDFWLDMHNKLIQHDIKVGMLCLLFSIKILLCVYQQVIFFSLFIGWFTIVLMSESLFFTWKLFKTQFFISSTSILLTKYPDVVLSCRNLAEQELIWKLYDFYWKYWSFFLIKFLNIKLSRLVFFTLWNLLILLMFFSSNHLDW